MKSTAVMFSLFLCFLTFAVKAQTSAATQPKVLVDNNKIKVTQYESMPGGDVCGKGRHTHPAHLTVLLTPADVKVTTADGKVITQRSPAGTSFWSDAETHEVVNSGALPMKILIIETKQ